MLAETTSTDEVISDNSAVYKQGNPNETFDDLDTEEMSSDDRGAEGDDDWSEDEGKPAKEAKKSEDLKLLSDSDDSDKKEGKDAKKSVEKEDKADDEKSKDDAKVEAKTEEVDKELPKSGKIKIRVGDDLYGLEPDTSVRVKVDGAYKDVPIAELVNNYSGKEAYDKKFTEIGNMRKEVETKTQTIAKKEEFVNTVAKTVKEIVSDPSKDPYEAVAYLAELMGVPTPDLHKRSLESRLDELSKLLDMTDMERENYFLKKETDYLRSRQDARMKQEVETQESQKFMNHVDTLRGKHNVSEEKFVEAMDELEQFYGEGSAQVTPEFVVEYAVLRPYLEKTKSLVQPYLEDIGEAKLPTVINQLANAMKQYGVGEAEIKAELEAQFGVSKSVKDLNAKLQSKKIVKETKQEVSESLESFDDFEF
ncbi:MAG: hypothetical protein ACK5X3_04620 [Pseudomonadota bacterium]